MWMWVQTTQTMQSWHVDLYESVLLRLIEDILHLMARAGPPLFRISCWWGMVAWLDEPNLRLNPQKELTWALNGLLDRYPIISYILSHYIPIKWLVLASFFTGESLWAKSENCHGSKIQGALAKLQFLHLSSSGAPSSSLQNDRKMWGKCLGTYGPRMVIDFMILLNMRMVLYY